MSHAPTVTFDRAAIRGRRLGRLLTQTELATRAGCCRKTLVEAEAGRPVGLLSAKAIARALGTGLRRLLAEPRGATGLEPLRRFLDGGEARRCTTAHLEQQG